jgi:hypothetical protein
MTAKSSIDPAEFLHEHLAQASPDLLPELMEGFINTLLSSDADSVCGAATGRVMWLGSTAATGIVTVIWTPGSGRRMWRSRSFAKGPTSRTGC